MLRKKEQRITRNHPILIVVLFLLTTIAVVLLIGSMSNASAEVIESAIVSSGWEVALEDNFESGIGGQWTVVDEDGSTGGEYFWATSTYTASQGTTSVWATGGGNQGSGLTAGTHPYPPNAISSMSAGPFDVSDVTGIRLVFDYWTETEEVLDNLLVYGSDDGSSYSIVESYDASSGGWQSDTIDFKDFVGNSQFWLKFTFSSNAADEDLGVFIDDVSLELFSGVSMFMPIVNLDATPTPTPIPAFSYFDDFSDPGSGWPIVDNTHVSNDCFKWYYSNGTYNADICDDRTDVKVSPLVRLPDTDYEVEVESRFKAGGGWWTSYGILFDAKDEPNPSKPDLGDYYMIWVLWEGGHSHKWKILRDDTGPGNQTSLTQWAILDGDVYDYGDSGRAFNTWKIVRTDNSIAVYVNGSHLKTISEGRPTTNYQYLFGLYTATYETGTRVDQLRSSFNYFKVDEINGGSLHSWKPIPSSDGGFYTSGSFELEGLLPSNDN